MNLSLNNQVNKKGKGTNEKSKIDQVINPNSIIYR